MGHDRFPTHRTGGHQDSRLSAPDCRPMMGFKVPGSNALSAGRLQCGVLLAQTPRRRFCEAANWEAVSQASSIVLVFTLPRCRRPPTVILGASGVCGLFGTLHPLSSLLYFWPEPIRDFRVV